MGDGFRAGGKRKGGGKGGGERGGRRGRKKHLGREVCKGGEKKLRGGRVWNVWDRMKKEGGGGGSGRKEMERRGVG